MTQYSTGFDSYTVGAQPSDWSARWVTASTTWAVRSKSAAQGGQCLEYTGTASARHLLTWDAIDADANRANVEILARARSSSTSSEILRLLARGSGAAGAESGYYFAFNGSAQTYQLQKLVAGTLTNLTSAINFVPVANAWYYLRFRVNGTTLSAKIWADGDAEPSAWTITFTDSSISTAGWVGVHNQDLTGTRDLDLFTVATNGDTAAFPGSGTTTVIDVSQVVTEAMHSTASVGTVSQALAEVAHSTASVGTVSQLAVEAAFSAPIAGDISQMVVEVAFSQSSGAVQQPQMIVMM
jgi:hypothetical protein